MTSQQSDRRSFLRAAAKATALAAVGPGLASALLACARDGALGSRLALFFADRKAASAVGEEILKRRDEPPGAAELVELLAGDQSTQWNEWATSDPARLAAALREQHRLDFDKERFEVVNGWVLSRTEALLCALASVSD